VQPIVHQVDLLQQTPFISIIITLPVDLLWWELGGEKVEAYN
jgi:hypothetical protein